MQATDFIIGGKYTISEDIYCIIQSKQPIEGAFVNIIEENEITIVMEQSRATHYIPSHEIYEIDRNWKIIRFDMELPFGLIGFLATISKALAESEIAIFVISAFSTDHILIKVDQIDKTMKVLNNLGMIKS
ncbi:MAG: ACT domain-containing protein [Candidatus Heimdallarchaeota archaeon]|nr:ACT domain-containing protein [Candidatus Heimdallarchaeota archaeon]